MKILQLLSCLLGLACASSAQTLASENFEGGINGWTFFARSSDSATGGLVTTACHASAGCFGAEQRGGQDWALWTSAYSRAVQAGEIWTWSVWAEIDTLAGSAGPTIAAFDATGKAISWTLAGATFPKRPTTWARYQANLVIPEGCTRIQPRLTGWGPGRMLLDDIELARTKAAPTQTSPLLLANDSLRLELDPLSLGIKLYDSLGHDSVVAAPLTDFSFDSLQRVGLDSARWFGQYVPGPWPVVLGIKLHGGEVRLAIHADSGRSLPGPMAFPGKIKTRQGQRLAMPRGTGITIPVDEPTYSWSHQFANFWQWQVSMGLVGATDGKTGFVLSIDQPSDASVSWGPQNGLLQPKLIQVPSKGIWMHDRTVLIAPLRGGGWAELAQRHHARQQQLGRARTWTQKIAANPKVDWLRGAMDFWVSGKWSKLNHRFFDTLGLYGANRALIHWGGASAATVDSLNLRGLLTSVYTQSGGALSGGSSVLDHEIPDGIALDSAGRMINGFQVVDSTGKTTTDYKRVSITRQAELLHTTAPPELIAQARNARFIDVLLAEDLHDDYSPRFPTSRFRDMQVRQRMLGYLKDTLGLVMGSEQTRDFAHAVVDYGEGPMSIACTADSPFDWTTPVPSTRLLDSLSFDPSRRVPLLLLSNHDGFAPTWYSGDGQSKVPTRWNAKDAWNILYGTMALILPAGRAMWDSLQGRYLRSILLVGAAHDRYGFEPMTNFEPLSADWRIQRTSFANGWSAVANLDTVSRIWNADTLAGNGFLARAKHEAIGRIVSGNQTISFVRLSDRWFFDPEGQVASLDGVRTPGGVSMTKANDTTIQLAFSGTQTSISLLPGSFPWAAKNLRATARGSNTPIVLSNDGQGWLGLTRVSGSPFYTLHGNFETLSVHPTVKPDLLGNSFRLRNHHGRVQIDWMQSTPGTITATLHTPIGTVIRTVRSMGVTGRNSLDLPAASGVVIAVLRTPDGVAKLTAANLRE